VNTTWHSYGSLCVAARFPENYPGPVAYAAFGVAGQEGKDCPVGFTKKEIGFDRGRNNCATCHTASYRVSADSRRCRPLPDRIIVSNWRLFRFLVDCAKTALQCDVLLSEIEQVPTSIGSTNFRIVSDYPLTKKFGGTRNAFRGSIGLIFRSGVAVAMTR